MKIFHYAVAVIAIMFAESSFAISLNQTTDKVEDSSESLNKRITKLTDGANEKAATATAEAKKNGLGQQGAKEMATAAIHFDKQEIDSLTTRMKAAEDREMKEKDPFWRVNQLMENQIEENDPVIIVEQKPEAAAKV